MTDNTQYDGRLYSQAEVDRMMVEANDGCCYCGWLYNLQHLTEVRQSFPQVNAIKS